MHHTSRVLSMICLALLASSSLALPKNAPLEKLHLATSEPRAAFAPDARFAAGDPGAPVLVTIYACGRSEACGRMIPRLYRELMEGRLQKKVQLHYRPFFPNDLEDAARCGRALVAAADQGRFWPFLLTLYARQDQFRACMLQKWADLEGLDQDAFRIAYDHPKTNAFLDQVHKEGVSNRVTDVPTVFINGFRVVGPMTEQSLIEQIEIEYANRASRETPPPPPTAEPRQEGLP